MKKAFSLIVCTLMLLALALPAAAADGYVYEQDFEKFDEMALAQQTDTLGKEIVPFPKTAKMSVAKFDGSKVYKIDTTGVTEQTDTFIDFFAGNLSTYGLDSAFVFEYDVYFEQIGTGNNFRLLSTREAAPTGTTFQVTALFQGTEDGKVALLNEKYESVATFETGKWLHVAVTLDALSDTFSVYVDGKCYSEDASYTINDTSVTDPERLRIAFDTNNYGGKVTEAVCYIDNVVAYNGTKLIDKSAATTAPVTTAASTTAPVEAPATADVSVLLAACAVAAASCAAVLRKKH